MDGGVADTTRANPTVLTQAVKIGGAWGKKDTTSLQVERLGARTAPVFPRLYTRSTRLLLPNTTRAHTPDPQAQESQSPWTEVWPTQPVLALPY